MAMRPAVHAHHGGKVRRPALSASRSFEIIELFASFPERRFTFSEIVKATKINISSCHSILGVMTEKGYLVRSEANKTYQLGPSMVAAGKVAEAGLSLVTRAEREAQRLLDEFGHPVMLSTIVGEELLAVLSLEDAAGNDTGLRGGERLPLIAPLGVPFLAWSSEERIERWLNRRSRPLDPALRERLHQDLRLTREHGYHVSLRAAMPSTIGTLMSDMARRVSIEDYRSELSDIIHSFDDQMCHPVEFIDDELYSVHIIAAPIFDRDGNVAYNLGMGGFTRPLTGATVVNYAERLTRTCLDIMREDRISGNAKAA